MDNMTYESSEALRKEWLEAVGYANNLKSLRDMLVANADVLIEEAYRMAEEKREKYMGY